MSNDFGGFGFNLEGYRRFKDQFPSTMGNNDRLLDIYRIRRTTERIVAEGLSLNTLSEDEKSGGAYMVYSACRARSILQKHGKEPIPAYQIEQFEINEQEAMLLLKLQQIPEKIAASAEQANSSLLIHHLLETAMLYNSYYTRAPVITDGVANPARLLITVAVQQSLINSLRLCHVDCPPTI